MNISEKAVLVRLSIKSIGNSKTDVRVTTSTIERENMQAGSGKWQKQLWPTEAIKPLTQLQGVIRTYHYENTLPWNDEGQRILPLTNHEAYTAAFRKFKSDWERAAGEFVAKFDTWLDWARTAHNGAFDRKNYPKTAERLARKFDLITAFDPVPTADDFRVTLSEAEMTLLRSDLDNRIEQAVAAAQQDLWRRLAEPLAKMVERLSDPGAKFRDSLVGNLAEIVGLIPRLNLTGDVKLQEFADEVGSTLATLDPEHLRKDNLARRQAADKAREISARMAGYFIAADDDSEQPAAAIVSA